MSLVSILSIAVVACLFSCASADLINNCKLDYGKMLVTNNCPDCSYYMQWSTSKLLGDNFKYTVQADGKKQLEKNRIFGLKNNIDKISTSVHIDVCLNDNAMKFGSFKECTDDYRKFMAKMLGGGQRSLRDAAILSRFLKLFKKRGLKVASGSSALARQLTKNWTSLLKKTLIKHGFKIVEVGVMIVGIVQFAEFLSLSKDEAAKAEEQQKAQKVLNQAMTQWMGKEVELQSSSIDLECNGEDQTAMSFAGKVKFLYKCSCDSNDDAMVGQKS